MMHEQHHVSADCRQYIGGDDAAAERICVALEPAVRAGVTGLLGAGDPDGDDVVQEVLLALLAYLRRTGIVPDNPAAFSVRIARNRCYNLGIWRRRRRAQDVDDHAEALPSLAASPLELMERDQKRRLVDDALADLDPPCRELLVAVYRHESSMEKLRRRLGLGSVQAVYHRRNICLEKARKFLNRRLFGCRSDRAYP